jgi:hypothetical protein
MPISHVRLPEDHITLVGMADKRVGTLERLLAISLADVIGNGQANRPLPSRRRFE